jgi:hypothetical protein
LGRSYALLHRPEPHLKVNQYTLFSKPPRQSTIRGRFYNRTILTHRLLLYLSINLFCKSCLLVSFSNKVFFCCPQLFYPLCSFTDFNTQPFDRFYAIVAKPENQLKLRAEISTGYISLASYQLILRWSKVFCFLSYRSLPPEE